MNLANLKPSSWGASAIIASPTFKSLVWAYSASSLVGLITEKIVAHSKKFREAVFRWPIAVGLAHAAAIGVTTSSIAYYQGEGTIDRSFVLALSALLGCMTAKSTYENAREKLQISIDSAVLEMRDFKSSLEGILSFQSLGNRDERENALEKLRGDIPRIIFEIKEGIDAIKLIDGRKEVKSALEQCLSVLEGAIDPNSAVDEAEAQVIEVARAVTDLVR